MELALGWGKTLDYYSEQILDPWSVQVPAAHAASLPPAAARSQFESTAASLTVGHSIISSSTFTDGKKEVIKNSDMQIRKNSRNVRHLSPIILLITSQCEGLPLSTGSLIIVCICPHFSQSNQ